MNVATQSDAFTARIRKRAKAFVKDNLRHPTKSDLLYTMNAMLIGASMAMETVEMETGHAYFFTYPLPLTSNSVFTYWRVKDSDEALGMAVSLYRHCEFHIEDTTMASYQSAAVKGN